MLLYVYKRHFNLKDGKYVIHLGPNIISIGLQVHGLQEGLSLKRCADGVYVVMCNF